MELKLIFPFIMIVFGMMSMILAYSHLLCTLLSLEFIMLNLFWFIFSWIILMNKELFVSLVFLTFSACEASLGLSLLVSLIRTHGNDFYSSLNLMTC